MSTFIGHHAFLGGTQRGSTLEDPIGLQMHRTPLMASKPLKWQALLSEMLQCFWIASTAQNCPGPWRQGSSADRAEAVESTGWGSHAMVPVPCAAYAAQRTTGLLTWRLI